MNLIKVDYYDKMINLANLRDAHLGQARPGQAESGLKGLDKAAYCPSHCAELCPSQRPSVVVNDY